ncbi:MAG: hypothetical protein COZ05_09230 [Armatimonadetes bacterium CG_4_10_14_3_um_filter_59_10]|nr:MAG: hypothetical protein COZ05_09230 [Armatimonadetes bacterium CG_4_10_14_3_um_filter_59_10]
MQTIHQSTFIILSAITPLLLTSASRCSADLTEFPNVAQARAFGWVPSNGAALEASEDSRVGKQSLSIKAGPQPQPYMGVSLRMEIDLTGANADDQLVFSVKQNFGSSVCVNLRVENVHIFRYFQITKEGWSEVEADLDLKNWENPTRSHWGRVANIAIYARDFDAATEYMLIDGFDVRMDGESVVSHPSAWDLSRWTFPQESEDNWYLGNADAAWAISRETGQVMGGWNARTKERYVNRTESRYHVDDRAKLVTGEEKRDSITKASFVRGRSRLELVCANADLPWLTVRKSYWLDGTRLFREVIFDTTRKDLHFITFNTEVVFSPAYRDDGYYMGAGYVGPLVPVPDNSSWQKVDEYRNTSKGMILHQPKKRYGFAHIRTRLDGNFVWPWWTGAIASYVEEKNALHYTPSGWDMSLGTSPLKPGRQTSFEDYFTIFPGDWQDFFTKEYPSLPVVRKALAEIPPVPVWVQNVKAYTSFRDMQHLKRVVEMTDEGEIMVLLGSTFSWADYYVDEGLIGWDGGWVSGPEQRDLIRRIKALSPRVKVGIYNWVLSAIPQARIYRKHPEWFRTNNKDGVPIYTFPGVAPNYSAMLSIDECYREILSQFDLIFDYLGADFIYLDDPKAVNHVDWKTGEYNRDDLTYRFCLDMKRIAEKHGPDKVIFYNCRGNPYGDINFIEARGQLRAAWWRHLSGMCAGMEAFLKNRADARIIPLYWTDPLARDYVNRVLALGWIPSITYGDEVGHRAYAQASYEIGNMELIRAEYSPDWTRDKATQVESYLMRRREDSGLVLSLINHNEADANVPVTINLDSLNLPGAGTVHIWEHVIEDAQTFAGIATESHVRQAYQQTGWQLDRVTRRRLVYAGKGTGGISLNLNMQPHILHQLYLSSVPAAVYAENNLPANYLFSSTPGVRLASAGGVEGKSIQLKIDNALESAEVMVLLPQNRSLRRVTVNGVAVEPTWVYEPGRVLPVVKVGKGKHSLSAQLEPLSDTNIDRRDLKPFVTDAGLRVSLPAIREAVFTIEKDGHVFFSRQLIAQGDNFTVPLAAPRQGGTYHLTLRATTDAAGNLRPVNGVANTIELSAAEVDLKLPPPKSPLIPERKEEWEINKTVRGLRVLRAAVHTTATAMGGFQPEMHPLTATADPDSLTLEAGTTAKIDDYLGAAFAGFEFENLRVVQLKLTNTYYGAFHSRGPENHVNQYKRTSREFAGIVIDYHTPKGYTKRVGLGVGVLHPDCNTPFPGYGGAGSVEKYDLGDLVNASAEKTFSLDLEPYAPAHWDGRVYFSVGSDWVCPDRRLKAAILVGNRMVAGDFLTGTDPRAVVDLFREPKKIEVPRAPLSPVLDGVSDDEMWQAAAKIDQFFIVGGAGWPKAKTEVKLFYNESCLYVGVVCEETDRVKPLIKGGNVWHDDEVEILLDIDNDPKTFHQILVNAVGTKMELTEKGTINLGTLTTAHTVENRQWTLEIAIPYEGLGVKPPKPGDVWGINVCRMRPPGGSSGEELITWAPMEHGFVEPENLAKLVFE